MHFYEENFKKRWRAEIGMKEKQRLLIILAGNSDSTRIVWIVFIIAQFQFHFVRIGEPLLQSLQIATQTERKSSRRLNVNYVNARHSRLKSTMIKF